MNKLYFKILLIIAILINLTSCASIANRDRSKPSEVYTNEGGIVGTGNTDECEKQNSKNSANCDTGVY